MKSRNRIALLGASKAEYSIWRTGKVRFRLHARGGSVVEATSAGERFAVD